MSYDPKIILVKKVGVVFSIWLSSKSMKELPTMLCSIEVVSFSSKNYYKQHYNEIMCVTRNGE